MVEGKLSTDKYNELRHQGKIDAPSAGTVIRRASWNEMKKRAGLETSESGRHGNGICHFFRASTDSIGSRYEVVTVFDGDVKHQVRIHRLQAVAYYGISEVIEKDVHHRSEHGLDNRPENLVCLDKSDHASEHGLGVDIHPHQ
jgi:hypothetical protein